jgi:DNA polymerase
MNGRRRTPEDCRWYRVCPLRGFEREGLLDGGWSETYCRGDWRKCVRYRMEEAGRPHPDWMLPDGSMDGRLEEFCRKGKA